MKKLLKVINEYGDVYLVTAITSAIGFGLITINLSNGWYGVGIMFLWVAICMLIPLILTAKYGD